MERTSPDLPKHPSLERTGRMEESSAERDLLVNPSPKIMSGKGS